jgi:hypothetical protein
MVYGPDYAEIEFAPLGNKSPGPQDNFPNIIVSRVESLMNDKEMLVHKLKKVEQELVVLKDAYEYFKQSKG